MGDKNNRAYRKAEDILTKFEINHSHSEQVIDGAVNIVFTKFDEKTEEIGQVAIFCPTIDESDDKAEASLNLLKHSDHGLWVGLNKIPITAPKTICLNIVIAGTSGAMFTPAIPAPNAGKSPNHTVVAVTITP